MSDLKLSVRTTNDEFSFNPNELTLRIVSQDLLSGTTIIYYELRDTTLINDRYISRDWCDRGSISIPSSLLLDAVDVDSQTLNEEMVNNILFGFNLEVSSIYPTN